MTVFWLAFKVKEAEFELAGIVIVEGTVSAEGVELETDTITG